MVEPIAIVGSACRFPGSASSPSQLWQLLQAPKDVIRDFPPERFNFPIFYNEDGDRPGRTNVKEQSYLLQEDCRLFDAAFFRINNKEAHSMDPQQRILLETVFEAFEAAGWPLETMEKSSTSVYVGVMTSDYNDIQMRDLEHLPTYSATGLARSILANRLSYFFDLHGPSMTIDTACSSSLVALHQAVQGLRNGDAAQAIVAGSTLLLDPATYIAESKLHMLSPDSRSRMWDKDVNGYARGEGCAAILLKPLSKAIEDNDDVECIIRETAVNSDGRTSGLTMPNSLAQADLIRRTYEKAGLDLFTDRCQYFECHGTGTSAGDLAEARAIHEAFFPNKDDASISEVPLYCGSVKTVIGHLEGCAGIAGVLKASLALQNKAIPPNMHFNQLSPALEPYYANLSVPTTLIPWPETSGKPLRASVNGFGFGGTNAHVILERYQPSSDAASSLQAHDAVPEEKFVGPFVFSAKTHSSLLNTLKRFGDHIRQNPSLDLDTLSWQLHSRRTAFGFRTGIAATTRQQLIASLEKQIATYDTNSNTQAPIAEGVKVLGVFTGQGAQWAAMGRELVTQCSVFRTSIDRCESALKALPDGPSWSLVQELLREGTKSRVMEGEMSQPLCTALQIALVDLLRSVGVKLDVVVGHSSGEVSAAYAAGILGLRDAMGISYYRGLVAHLAQGITGQAGAMIAVGMDFAAAISFCSQPRFAGRIGLAASNSPRSVTLSGDLDAIHEAKTIFDQEEIFTRILKVDKAYHSRHMARCTETYSAYLKSLNITIQAPRNECIWYSSVYENFDSRLNPLESLSGPYWIENMVRPVLFSQGLEAIFSQHQSILGVLEVGPHPALKGPVNEIFSQISSSPLPYTGCLNRAESDIEAVSSALALLWTKLGPSSIDFAGWRDAFDKPSRPRLLKGLPSYTWDHETVYWHESRLSHEYRHSTSQSHELLGRLQQDNQYEMTWRNVFRLKDIPWLQGHMFQGQVIYPAAGYVSMVTQAAEVFTHGRPMKMLEIQDMNIVKALTFHENDESVEMLLTLRTRQNLSKTATSSVLLAVFTCYACSDGQVLEMCCDGLLLLHVDQAKLSPFPASTICEDELPPLDVDRFFRSVAGLGISYEGVFRAFKTINRIWGSSKASATWAEYAIDQNYLLHPAILDVSFQAGFATFITTADKAMGSTYLPTKIRHAFIDPHQNYRACSGEIKVEIDAHLVDTTDGSLEVDINVYDQSSKFPGIRIDGLVLKAIAEPQPSDDRQLFAKTIWDVDVTSGFPVSPSALVTEAELQYVDAVERTALYFLQEFYHTTRHDEIEGFKWHHQALYRSINLLLDPIRKGIHPVLKRDWLKDKHETIQEFSRRYPNSVDLALLTAVGTNLASVVRGHSEMLEHMLKDNLLERLYTEGRGFAACNENIANLVSNISHKYPRMKILEVGAGTGGTTNSVLTALGASYLSYTYTDISMGFFEKAANRFSKHSQKMIFKLLNVEEDPCKQGFCEKSYDIIIAANVLHATRSLSQTVQNVRSLLRPGGYLIAAEVTGAMLRETGLMGGLEGWWLGVEDGRISSPAISAERWNDLLLANRFSGVESIIYDMPDISRHNCSVFVAQALDEKLELVLDPLIASPRLISESRVLIIGGHTIPVFKAVRHAERLLRRWTQSISICLDFDNLDPSKVSPGSTILCLAELDQPVFSGDISDTKLENLQEMLSNATNILWITAKRLAEDPCSNMMIGIGRSLVLELPQVKMQYLDFDQQSSLDMEMAVQYLLRMVILSSPQYENHEMLWVQEPEIIIKGNTTLIPRLMPDHALNESLNANRRRVTKSVEPSDSIQISYASSPPSLAKSNICTITEGKIEIDVNLSVSLHSVTRRPLFLCFGHTRAGRTPAFVLSETDSSVVFAPRDHVLELPSPRQCNASHLVAVGAALVASHIISGSPAPGTIMVHQPSSSIAEALARNAKVARRNVIVLSAMEEVDVPNRITVDPLSHPRTIRPLIPDDVAIVWLLSDINVDNILSCLPKACLVQTFDPRSSHLAEQLTTINDAIYAVAQTDLMPSVIKINDCDDFILHDFEVSRLSTVTEWHRTKSLEVIVPPLDRCSVFAPDRTYLMVGMTGALGQSLCRYMVSCGARHIVLASRHADPNAKWPNSLRLSGADICLVQMDVTDSAQVHQTISNIRETMPLIAGVANAALVLEDSLFQNTSAASIERQLKPKVNGTTILDEEFLHDHLDFFIAFSSLATECGNAGQSVYHAANMFMQSLIAKRRLRGQPASIINIGMISDVGYLARNQRTDLDVEQHLRSQFYTPLAEAEFHHLMVQAILSGRSESTNENITMGIEIFVDSPDATARPPWFNNPRFSHMITSPVSTKNPAQTKTTQHDLQSKLEETDSLEEVSELFQDQFCKKLESMMKIPVSSINVSAPLFDLGLDSLLAVEMRIWLLNDLRIDVPLLDILGRASVSSISSRAAQCYIQTKTEASISEIPLPSETTVDVSDIKFIAPDTLEPQVESSKDSDSPRFTPCATPEPDCVMQPEYLQTEVVSFPQASLYFLQNFLQSRAMFNVTAQYAIKGQLSTARFSRALEKTLEFHGAYQTRFFNSPGASDIHQGITLSTFTKNRLTISISTTFEDVQDQFDGLTNHEWDLATGDMFKAIVFSHTPDSHTVIFGCHHIIMDGTSWHIFLRDLDQAYQLRPFETAPSSYLDFSRRQLDTVRSGELEQSINYWLHELDPIPQTLPLLPFSQKENRMPLSMYSNHVVHRTLNPEIVSRIKSTSQELRTTTMQFYLAVVQTLFTRLFDLEEICIGVTEAGRGLSGEFSETIGHFTNLLPMRFHVNREHSFAELAENTSRTVLNGFANAKVPMEVILERLGMQRSSSLAPLFQVAFNYRIGDLLEAKLGNCTLQLEKYVDAKVPYDWTFNLTQTAQGGHLLEITSNDSLYSIQATEFMMNTYIVLLDSIVLDPIQDLRSFKLYTEAQVNRELALGSGPTKSSVWPDTLTERFQQVCSTLPSAIAIKDSQHTATYAQLSYRVGTIVSALINSEVKIGDRVVVLCEPSIDIYAVMLAVLHIGAIYIPLDSSLPVERQRAMLKASNPIRLVFHNATTIAVRKCNDEVHVQALNISDLIVSTRELPPASVCNSGQDAFILFTSGSTGTPKGIRIAQKGVMNYVASKRALLDLRQVIVLQQSSIGFDMSIAQAFNAFANAGTLVVASTQCRGDPIMITRLMLEEDINFTICTPTEYLMLATYATDFLRLCTSWKYACSGGEIATEALLAALHTLEIPNLKFVDCYGPTEISCAATLQSIHLNGEVKAAHGSRSVGSPITNTSIFIVDDDCVPLPSGFSGQICIAGPGVANGYLDENLNSTKFLPHPFPASEEIPDKWSTIYMTGDRGCLRQDGTLVFLGRMEGDTLIKLRGFRIELNEIAHNILQTAQGLLSDVVVTVRGTPEFLVAHVMLAPGNHQTQEELEQLLNCLPLPRYMIPALIIPVAQLPTSINGKVDRKMVTDLPLSTPNSASQDTKLTVAEGELRMLWREVLGEVAASAHIKADTDFFMVGGSSLLLVRLQNALKESMGVHLALSKLYHASTLRAMALATNEERSQTVTEAIAWLAETAIDDFPWEYSETTARGAISSSLQKSQRQIVLTGATGFLGSQLLAALISDGEVACVHCIAVPVDAQNKLPKDPKVMIYLGSLSSPSLGLSRTDTEKLKNIADQIIHAGSQGHCLNNYTSLRNANVLSTKFLAAMALPRQIPFHFISSPRVILQSGNCTSPPISMAAYPPPTDGSQGFTSSKWASEVFLESLAARTSLPVVIHRPCSVIGAGAPHDDAMNAVIRYSILSRKVPDLPNIEGFFDFKDVAIVVSDIIRGTIAPASISFRHYSSEVQLPFRRFQERMETLYSGSFATVPISEWISSAVELGIEELIVRYLESNIAGGGRLIFPYLGRLS